MIITSKFNGETVLFIRESCHLQLSNYFFNFPSKYSDKRVVTYLVPYINVGSYLPVIKINKAG